MKTLAILGGTGKEGAGLAMRWALHGYHVIIGSRSAEKAETRAKEMNKRIGRRLSERASPMRRRPTVPISSS